MGPAALLASWMEHVRRGRGKEGCGGPLSCHALGELDRLVILFQTLLLSLAGQRLRVGGSSPPGHQLLHGIHDRIVWLRRASDGQLRKAAPGPSNSIAAGVSVSRAPLVNRWDIPRRILTRDAHRFRTALVDATRGGEGVSVLDPWVEIRSAVASIERRESQLLQASDDSTHQRTVRPRGPNVWETEAISPISSPCPRAGSRRAWTGTRAPPSKQPPVEA